VTYNLIENARKISGFSGDSLEAVRKVWKCNQDSMKR